MQVLIIAFVIFYFNFIKPKNSLELYQSFSFAKDYEEAKQFMLEGYEDYLDEDDFHYINNLNTIAEQINQFTLFVYNDKTYVLMTSPGTHKLEVLNVEELPEEVRAYFLKMGKDMK